MTSGGKAYYYLTDNQGAPLVLVDGAGTRAGSWSSGPVGDARGTAGAGVPQPFGCTGAYLDDTGLYKMGARYYDPATARFTQPDPSGRETNTYLYAAGGPVNRMDPDGTYSWSSDLAAALTGGAGLVAGSLLFDNPLGAAVAGGAIAGCAGAAVATSLGGGTGTEDLESCATWGAVGAVAGGLLAWMAM
ncbi:RHS repeat-associated core domain-containing protein [Streptacidiphilus sp. ASG 303]|uniref:RHS repeat-associated core domain-containing protein n=1 Tax=Streptacidiphilus sp. ASG 303 TaxID=2896847 RepID=UPI001E2B1F37|nr:RHS repeat-associated core domain-containing protein [Streptacidiphilus sp. ASG 303]MCD0484342.1 RHS repeat-associated core domain-containing protein [Streptacidiphilus sp. ASG 303]